MENEIFKIKCLNCNGDTSHWGKKNSYDLFRCISCGLIFTHPIPDSQSIYDRNYFSGASKGFGYTDYDTDKEAMIPTFNKYLDLFEKYGRSDGRIFDIGAATGFFLKIARGRGYQVSGVEISDYAAGQARLAGIDISTGNLLSLSFPSNSFDIVTMLDVLEHMTDPFAELLETKKILKNGGLLAVNTPNGRSFLAKVLKTKWHLVLPPEHLFYFSPKNLGMFLEHNGFKVLYSGVIGKRFTFQYIFKTLHKWQKLSIWNYFSILFSKGFLSRLYIPINLYDNFFMIFEKIK